MSARDTDETPAMAAPTPSAMQARKMPKPRSPRAQLAQGEAQDEGRGGADVAASGFCRNTVPCKWSSLSLTRPERRRRPSDAARNQLSPDGAVRRPFARPASWVTENERRPALALERETGGRRSSRRSSRRGCRWARRRRRSPGSGASARAMATRCCSPPDSWAGVMRQALAETHRAQLGRSAVVRVAPARELERQGDVSRAPSWWG